MSDLLLAMRIGGASLESGREDVNLDNRQAMDRFLAEVESRAYRIAQFSVQNADDALDIVQDSMIRLARRYSQRAPAEWRPLFYRILRNRILDYQRRQTVHKRVFAWLSHLGADGDATEDMIANAPDREQARPDHQVAMDDAMQRLSTAIRELPARQQQAFLLRALEGLDVGETAAVMGCTAGSVKTHYSRAVHRLRQILGEHWS